MITVFTVCLPLKSGNFKGASNMSNNEMTFTCIKDWIIRLSKYVNLPYQYSINIIMKQISIFTHL